MGPSSTPHVCPLWRRKIQVIIPSKKLSTYFRTLQFPVQILEEKGDQVARVEDKRGLMALIETEAVIGIGSWNRIRHLRLNRPMESLTNLRIKLGYPLSVAASKTVIKVNLDSGHQIYVFDGKRCIAYRQERPRLDTEAL